MKYIFILLIPIFLISCATSSSRKILNINDSGNGIMTTSINDFQWDHDDNINQAALKFGEVHTSEGMGGSGAYVPECYDNAVAEINYKKIEYCLTFHTVGHVFDLAFMEVNPISTYSTNFRSQDVKNQLRTSLNAMGNNRKSISPITKAVQSQLKNAFKLMCSQVYGKIENKTYIDEIIDKKSTYQNACNIGIRSL